MTIEQADEIAALVGNAPHMYDSIPSLEKGMEPVAFNSQRYSVYPWISLANSMGGLIISEMPKNPNVYYSDGGFSSTAYSSAITDWAATELQSSRGIFGQRYITIDDIRMMAYLGLEYAKAKLDGWRYRFGYVSGLDREATDYPKGYIARLEDGSRFVHRSGGNVTAPPGSGGKYSDQLYAYKYWTPMRRLPGCAIPTSGTFRLPDDYEVREEVTSEIVELGSIEGADDMVRFGPYVSDLKTATARTLNEPESIVTGGGFEIIVTTRSSLTEDDIEQNLVAYQQRVQNYYVISEDIYDSNGKFREKWTYDTIRKPPQGERYTLRTMIESTSSFVPLRKGVVYNVFLKFDSATIKANNNNKEFNIVSYARYGTRKVAPFMWESTHPTQRTA